MTKDFVLYIDTDSIFYSIEDWIGYHIGLEKWNNLDDLAKISVCKRISKIVVNHVNTRIYDNVQLKHFNSRKDFKFIFEQEIIARAALFVAKKKYGMSIVDKNGIEKDNEIFVRGLEIVQSSTPRAIKPLINNIMGMVLSGVSDKEISQIIKRDKKELVNAKPDEISVNIGANNLSKYIISGEPTKGAPWHIKGINNYHKMLNSLGLSSKYPQIKGVGEKVKVVYISKPNKYNVDNISFLKWPIEFDIKIDYKEMIERFYVKKIEKLLKPINKTELLNSNIIDLFG